MNFEVGHPENWEDATDLFEPDVPPTEMVLETKLGIAEYRELEAYAKRQGTSVGDAVRQAIRREIRAGWYRAPETASTALTPDAGNSSTRSEASSKKVAVHSAG
jgi:hypothetical protein